MVSTGSSLGHDRELSNQLCLLHSIDCSTHGDVDSRSRCHLKISQRKPKKCANAKGCLKRTAPIIRTNTVTVAVTAFHHYFVLHVATGDAAKLWYQILIDSIYL